MEPGPSSEDDPELRQIFSRVVLSNCCGPYMRRCFEAAEVNRVHCATAWCHKGFGEPFIQEKIMVEVVLKEGLPLVKGLIHMDTRRKGMLQEKMALKDGSSPMRVFF